jgi:hypothetical protein
VLACALAATLAAQGDDEEFRVYTDHPRLILNSQRLHMLRRERERDTARWHQFDALLKGGASMPEPGFALALDYAVASDNGAGKRAVDWALGPGQDLRQLGLVYDWCQPLLSPQQSAALATKIRGLMQKDTGDSWAARRDRALALIATADSSSHPEEAPLQDLVRRVWRTSLAPALANGRAAPSLADFYALLEMMHAIRDNVKIDLREDARDYFAHLPLLLIAANYPAPYQAPENEFRIPMDASGQADLQRAALARAAGLAMVAFDHNRLENQYLQSWLMQDRFSMLTPFGAPYEFLWANPYQPGLSYDQLPLVFHDPASGTLFVRSNWDEDADWFGLYAGQVQVFHSGRATAIDRNASGSSKPEPLHLGNTSVVFGRPPFQFSMDGGTVVAIGLRPGRPYSIETDDEEMREVSTDPAGSLLLEYPADRVAGVRVHE